MNGIMKAYDLLIGLAPETNEMEFYSFGSFLCMLLEEWCLKNKKDILECISVIHNMITQVNEEEGVYLG